MREWGDDGILESREHLIALGEHFGAFIFPGLGKVDEDISKARPSVTVVWREISSAHKRFEIGGKEHAHRPATTSGGRLNEGHIDPIHVGPFFAIDFDADKVSVQQIGDLGVIKRFMGHYMAPVTGRIADREKYRFVTLPRLLKRGSSPRPPIHRLMRMLQKIRRFLTGEMILSFRVHFY